MRSSIAFWVYCIVLAVVMHGPLFFLFFGRRWLVPFVYFPIIRYSKRFFFRHILGHLRFHRNETVVVTGATAGIGAQCAKQLTERGGHVIWAGRRVDKAQNFLDRMIWTSTHGKRGYALKLDLGSLAQIDEFVEDLKKRENKIDVLILNAAYHGPAKKTIDGHQQTFQVNHLGHMYLTYRLLDLLKVGATKDHPSKVIVVGSDLHRLSPKVNWDDLEMNKSYGQWNSYNQSKLFNLLFARRLSTELQENHIVVHTTHPGTPVQSELMRDYWLGKRLMNLVFMPIIYWAYCRSAVDGAQTIMHGALSQECRENTNLYFENCKRDNPSSTAKDSTTADRLWDMSCDMLQIPKTWH